MEESLRQQESDKKRQRVLVAATELFAANGFKKTSAQAVADEAGVSKGLVFLFFNNKLGLFEAVVAELMARLALHTDEQVSKVAGDPIAELQSYFSASIHYILKEPLLLAILRQEERVQVTQAMDNAENYGADNIRELIERGVSEGVFRADLDPLATTQILLDLMLGMMERYCRGENRISNDHGIEEALRFIHYAVLP